ncbi:hypothetical protein GJA_3128 [Janthinobacterium agaricidamnosum NBRC 102515 = DSM 9628]|uniref:Uncharacterized protein n=1 Tax=Janthinobacterium agaricidamnosum NBRC 102515 = DSM 9628 TaxID=1349767 RepID=W0V8S3_9BURK|nr:hypothetical protein GJA_3128 [Janthinobacterium agaricidamnosum NBRC 102515 = DSM 9628]
MIKGINTDDITVNIDTVIDGSVPEVAMVYLTDSVPGRCFDAAEKKIAARI